MGQPTLSARPLLVIDGDGIVTSAAFTGLYLASGGSMFQ